MNIRCKCFSCTNIDRLNDEQKTAIINIAEGGCRPLAFLLYGPAGMALGLFWLSL